MPTGIGYLDETWNMILGCTHMSQGCAHCWAEGASHVKLSHPNPKISGAYAGVTKDRKWTGLVKCLENRLEIPLHWKKPRRIGVSFMADLFHKDVPFEFINKVHSVMREADHHQYIVLTKRAERMMDYYQSMLAVHGKYLTIGVSVEDQATADERIPLLLQTPASTRIVSYEPALGPVNFEQSWVGYLTGWETVSDSEDDGHGGLNEVPAQSQTEKIDQVIMGGESGGGHRPMDLEWARSVRDQCKAAGVAFYFKQTAGRGEIPDDLQIREMP